MAIVDHVTELAASIVSPLGLDLYDVESNGGNLKVTVSRDGGVDLDTIAEVTRLLSRALDADDPMPGRYTLEVSSPGLERRLRRPDHWAGAVGEIVSIKLGPDVEGDRRLKGELIAVDEHTVTVRVDGAERAIALDDVTRATTVFEWGPTPKPRGGGARTTAKADAESASDATHPGRRAAAR